MYYNTASLREYSRLVDEHRGQILYSVCTNKLAPNFMIMLRDGTRIHVRQLMNDDMVKVDTDKPYPRSV